MKLTQLIDEDFVNYKTCSMFIGTSKCSFKCDKENGNQICQNYALSSSTPIEIKAKDIATRYVNNSLSEAIVIGGLEPFDTPGDLSTLVAALRLQTSDPIVIYTGYTEKELASMPIFKQVYLLNEICSGGQLIIKCGRFIPGRPHILDKLLGIELSSDNQYAFYAKELVDKTMSSN